MFIMGWFIILVLNMLINNTLDNRQIIYAEIQEQRDLCAPSF